MEWVPVIKDVPENNTPVLISFDEKYVDLAIYRNGRFILTTGRIISPDAWIKLPNPFHAAKHEKGYYERMVRAQKLMRHGIIKC